MGGYSRRFEATFQTLATTQRRIPEDMNPANSLFIF